MNKILKWLKKKIILKWLEKNQTLTNYVIKLIINQISNNKIEK